MPPAERRCHTSSQSLPFSMSASLSYRRALMLQQILRLIMALPVGVFAYGLVQNELTTKHFLILLAVPLALVGLGHMQRQEAASGSHGWRKLSPSAMHWAGLALSVGLTALLLYVYLFVGSSRPDAAKQMNIVLGLMLAFGSAAIAMCVICFHAVVRWNEERIESWLGPWQRGAISWRELAQAEHEGPGTPLVLESFDGLRLKIDATLNGADELLQRVAPWMAKQQQA